MDKLLILGAGGHGKVVAETAELMDVWSKISFLDDNKKNVLGKCSDYIKLVEEYKYAIPAFGDNTQRKDWIARLEKAGYILPVIIHPNAYISKSAEICPGTVVLANAVVNADTGIGKGCIINIGALVDHDSEIGECVHIKAGVTVRSMSRIENLSTLELAQKVWNIQQMVYDTERMHG